MSEPEFNLRPAPSGYAGMGASISACGRYRWRLWRYWGDGPLALWIMLNPSTANEYADDPTIRRCVRFSNDWGMAGLLVGNVFAFRTTYPSELARVADPVGDFNDRSLAEMAAAARVIVCAWGASPMVVPESVRRVWAAIGGEGRTVVCLGKTASGAPRHPLYLPADAAPEVFYPQ